VILPKKQETSEKGIGFFWVITQREVVFSPAFREKPISPSFIVQESEFFTPEKGTDRLFRNVGKKLPILAA
jgi:hypothetical protein